MSQSAAINSIFGRVRQYYVLTKPNIISLLLVSTACPMYLAAGGWVDVELLFWTVLGGATVSASACVINCIFDRDIDAVMSRTKNRPLPSGQISVSSAWIYSAALFAVGFCALYHKANPLAAYVSTFGHVFYVLVYTAFLKRSTVQNIVIGGAAGAVPPMVGWVAVTGELSLTAWLLFLVVFLWTPPHFWALALNKNDDYQRAEIPMLPVVAGEESTKVQMFWYSVSLILPSVLLVAYEPNASFLTAFVLAVINGQFIYKNYVLLKNKDKERDEKLAWSVFGYSLLYLAVFFFVQVIDGAIV